MMRAENRVKVGRRQNSERKEKGALTVTCELLLLLPPVLTPESLKLEHKA